MSRLLKERLKTICIFLLIILGILQVGILWGYQNQGTPTSFILRIFNRSTQISSTEARERLFVPERLILLSGGKSHWVLDKDSDFYDDFWDEAKQGLISIASGNVSLKASDEVWGDVAEKRGFIIDFGYEIPPELMKWFLFGTSHDKQELPPVYKLMVKPDIIDGNASILYICSTGNKVYVSDSISYERTKSINDIITAISENKDQEYRDYSTFNSANVYEGTETEPDVLFVTASPSYWPYFEYSCEPPARAEIRDELLEAVLGAEKDRYNMNKSGDNMEFTYGSNIYRYYNDGYLTYNYLGSVDTSGNVETDSLLNAYKFVARVKGILETSADIILTSAEEEQTGVFRFTFDYRLKGMPVQVDLYMKDGNEKKLEHAIIIQADSKRVLSCDWLLRDFAQNGKGYYMDRFIDVVGKTGMNSEELTIKDMRSGYLIDSSSDRILKPKLLIERKDSPLLSIEMLPQEGD